MRAVLIFGGVTIFLATLASAQSVSPEVAEAMIRDLQQSHIDANVPDAADFDRILRRDLRTYFSLEENGRSSLVYEFLRESPTQTGIAFPKFYVWVRIEGDLNREGALRLAAIARERFDVREFLTRRDIEASPSIVDSIFPPPVAQAIKNRVSKSND